MTTLVLSPDFVSHYQPLSIVSSALARAGERVVVATGDAMAPAVVADGLEFRRLILSAGSNAGIARADEHDRHDAGALDSFIEATRAGIVPTLIHQAQKRRRELLWDPIAVGAAIRSAIEAVDPDRIIVDQVSLVSTLGVLASGRPFITLVPGHPTQLPVGDETYGDLPATVRVPESERVSLRAFLDDVNAEVTGAFNTALHSLASGAVAVDDAFGVSGDLVGYHWSRELHDPARIGLLPDRRVDLGPLVRTEELPADLAHLAAPGAPIVVVALGTFLSRRIDVLQTITAALAQLDVRAVIAIGDNAPATFASLPDGWVVRARIPQVATLRLASCAVSHGGNNSVQEALAAGVRQIVLPLSTDQPAIAADVERVGAGVALDPNAIDPAHLAAVVQSVIEAGPVVPMATRVDRFVDVALAG